jgi:nucleotide-binding universal stress UspA family protein
LSVDSTRTLSAIGERYRGERPRILILAAGRPPSVASMYDTILVPTDGSDPANRAVEHGIELAERFGATLHALYVVDTTRYGEPALSSAEIVLQELEEDGTALVTDIAERADNHGVTVETRVCHGAPHAEIITYADEVNADLVVMGYQGHSHSMAGHMGSVADRVTQRAGRPVLTA